MTGISYTSNVGSMADSFEAEIEKAIEATKRDLDSLVSRYEKEVRDVNTPSGPSHREPRYTQGSLRRSVDSQSFDHGDFEAWSIAVGGPDIDYVRYVAARDGVELFRGTEAVEAEGNRIMSEHWGQA